MNPTDEQIRTALRAAMAARNVTQAELARRLEVKQPSVAAILSGKRGSIPQSLLDVLEALDLELTAHPRSEAEKSGRK
ncbi:helix-turn-helix domain-containing protein [Deinococcus hopiensis]|nr:helix-turn-helix transcriptional regulator [Deinococcus hopiensis]